LKQGIYDESRGTNEAVDVVGMRLTMLLKD
jgi:hypothetical protein